MSWSLRVSNGDLVLQSGKLGIVSGQNKLVQDLRHFLLERMGSDPLHPDYGSLIDGGVTPAGRTVASPIGGTDWRFVALELEADIRRICALYQNGQVERARKDRQRYNRVTLTPAEILLAVTDVTFQQNMDTLNVTISLSTGAGTTENLSLALGNR